MKKLLFLSLLSLLTSFAGPIVFDSNERVTGYTLGSANSLPTRLLAELPNGYSVVNLGSTGKSAATMIANFPSQVAPYGASSDALVFAMGGDELAAGASVATVKSNIAAYYNLANAYFLQVFILPILPRGTAIGNYTETNRITLNTWQATNFPACFVPTSYEPSIYANYDHSWSKYTSGNPWFLDVGHLNEDGILLEMAGLRRFMQKQHLIPTADPSFSVGTTAMLTITGLRGNVYDVYATLDSVHGPWDRIDSIVLPATTSTWFDISGVPFRYYGVVGVAP